MSLTIITTRNGRYTLTHTNGNNLEADRDGEPWRDLRGDNLVLSLVQDIEYLQTKLDRIGSICNSTTTA